MKRKRSPGAIEYLAVKCLAAAPTQPSEQSLDVLACSQGVDRKVGTGTVVIEQARPSHRYPVSFVAGRAYGIISVQVPIRPGQNAHDASVSPFATRRNLLFDYHEEPLSGRVNAHQQSESTARTRSKNNLTPCRRIYASADEARKQSAKAFSGDCPFFFPVGVSNGGHIGEFAGFPLAVNGVTTGSGVR